MSIGKPFRRLTVAQISVIEPGPNVRDVSIPGVRFMSFSRFGSQSAPLQSLRNCGPVRDLMGTRRSAPSCDVPAGDTA